MAFTIKKSHGLYISFDSEGTPMITAPTEELCAFWSEKYLAKNWEIARVVNDGKVGGKL